MKPARKRKLAWEVIERHEISGRRACRLLKLHRSVFAYRSRKADDRALRMKLRDLAYARPRYGYRRLAVLLQREGWVVNHKRVHRLYQEEELHVRIKRRKKRAAQVRIKPPPAIRCGEHWAIDFMADQLADGRRFRIFAAVDYFSRECVGVEVGQSLSSQTVTAALDRAIARYGMPEVITLDNGSEFSSNHFDGWAYRRGIRLDFISPGRPVENGMIESFNGKLRDECLNMHWFESLQEARELIEQWCQDYNEMRPHSSLGNLAPAHYVEQLLKSTDVGELHTLAVPQS